MKGKNFSRGVTLIALVVTIIVLLILAGVSIAMLTGDNGILIQANEAKEKNTIGGEKEQIQLAVQSLKMKRQAENVTDEINVNGYLRVKYEDSKNEYTVDQSGNIESAETGPITQPENIAASWEAVSKLDTTWFSYNDLKNNKEKVKVNAPVLKGNMKAIKYVGTDANEGSKWANAMTADGSMFVWLPRYAYKITEGYHTNVAGEIDVIFIDTNNKSLNGETEEITTNVEDPEAGKTKYLVHPAFTANAEAGGGFGELAGIWVGKFEATGNIAASWEAVSKLDTTWFSYNDLKNNKEKVKVNAPVLKGNMKAIKYVGTDANEGSKWANAMTADGSMFVWLPRYAYKITEGYHTNVAGEIDVIFIDTNNKSLNGETEEITTNVEDPEAGKTKYLVHPAFTANAEAGGGFGELAGIWVGKFEATGTYRGKTGKSTTYKIDNIDKLPPKDFEGRITNKTSNSITVEGTTTDAEATQTDGSSGIRGYKFSKDNGASWTEEQSEGRYTYGRLASSTQYNILIKAIDNAGNEKTSKVVQGTTEEIPSGVINFSYEPSEWTNKDVTVTIDAKTSDYTLQYSLNGNEWNNYDKISKVVMKENGPVYARLTDGINYGITATGNVNNIDRDKPQVTNNVYSEGTKKGELYINIDAKDEASGVTSISNLTTGNITEISDTSNASGVKVAQGKYRVTAIGQYNFKVTDKVGNETQISVNVTDLLWTETSDSDENWYSYIDLNSNKEVKVNKPTLKGKMKPIKYVGPESNTQGGSKWANAKTADGSMWVWIPRYAYKITEGYHTSQAGTIEVAFLDTNNNFLNGETGELTTNVEDPEAGITKWLVHPAFTSNAEAGGGFGEIPGLWVGKFETTGEYTNGDSSKVSVKPGSKSLTNMTINQQYQAGKNATFGEGVNLNSHMAKNSEWGVTVYLAHSKYGTNKKKVETNESFFYSGGVETGIEEEIYTTNKLQSTTHNATGVYDLNGGASEYVASYVGGTLYGNARENGGINIGDLYGATKEEQSTSTKYKTVYTSEVGEYGKDPYEISGKKNKGDAMYETSSSVYIEKQPSSWFGAYANFPNSGSSFFLRGGINEPREYPGIFHFNSRNGEQISAYSFRMVIAP